MSRSRFVSLVALVALVSAAATYCCAPTASAAPSVVERAPLPRSLWIPGTASAERLTYTTVGATGAPATSTGAVFLPTGPTPARGWPVVAWAHGTAGLADQCAPSLVGPAAAERDRSYLATWLADGYAIVASDYTGLGTPGAMPYLNGKVTAHNIVDMVSAVASDEPRVIGNRWAVVGQSQGAGAAVVTARYATSYGGAGLRYVGAVATGVPAYVESLVGLLGPWVPPFALPPDFNAFALYIVSGLRSSHPELGIDSYLTESGRAWVDTAERTCLTELRPKVAHLILGKLFSKPLSKLPNSRALLRDYMGLPETGYDKPLFVAQGLRDTEVPTPFTFLWAAVMTARRQPLDLHTYGTDHSGTMTASLPDSRPFLARRFAAAQ